MVFISRRVRIHNIDYRHGITRIVHNTLKRFAQQHESPGAGMKSSHVDLVDRIDRDNDWYFSAAESFVRRRFTSLRGYGRVYI